MSVTGLAGLVSLSSCTPIWRTQPLASVPAPQADAIAARLLARMSLDEKVGQLMVVAFTGPTFTPEAEQMVRQYHVGGVILFAQNLLDGVQIKQLTGQLQQAAQISLLLAVDQEGGPVVRVTQGATLFPSQMAVGATFSPATAAAVAAATAWELRELGINANFAPVADVNSNPRNPVIGVRSYGADPGLVGKLTAAAVDAVQAAGVVAVAKHFPGHGDADVDSHLALPLIGHPLSRLEAVELPPFRAAIAAGVDAVMTAHVLLPALDSDPRRSATLSPPVLSYLREKLGYTGLIVTDDLEMGAIVNDHGTAEAARLAFQAGADLLLFRRNVEEQRRAHALLVAAMHNGEISPQRLDVSVRRILATKARRGLLDQIPAARERGASRAGSAGAQRLSGAEIARDVARRSVTLVKNEGGLLPLKPADDVSLCVIYPRPEAVNGVNSVEVSAGRLPSDQPQTLGDAVKLFHPGAHLVPVGLRPPPEDAQAALAGASTAQVVVLGTYNAQEYPSQDALMKRIVALGKPTAVVALRLPYDLSRLDSAPALMAAYSNRPASLRAVAEALFGRGVPPSGHLPVPLEPHWPLGFGLLEWSKPQVISDVR